PRAPEAPAGGGGGGGCEGGDPGGVLASYRSLYELHEPCRSCLQASVLEEFPSYQRWTDP
ncbi:hypothetical protein Tco_0443602, partial [Tanacetum coccineum]